MRPLLALAAFLSILPCVLAAGEPEPLEAVLLTRDLGDPRAPGSAKLALALPESLEHRVSSAKASDFRVYVYPAALGDEAGSADRHLADGVYLWRFKSKIFLDVRSLPMQEEAGPARVKVVYAPEGEPLAEGYAEGESRYAPGAADVVLAVDVSRSMLYNDPRKRRVVAARTFIEMAREGGGIGRVGLVTFNQRAEIKTPLTQLRDGETLLRDLNRVGADGLTSLDAPLEAAMYLFQQAGSDRPVVILLTDGQNEGSYYRNTHLRCAQAGIRLFTVGLTESADHRLLAEMAEASGGIYFRAPTDQDLPEIYARLAAELGKRYLMHADILPTASGSLQLPVDATVKRMIAMSDGGATVRLVDPSGREAASGASTGTLGSVFVGKPEAGEWRLGWDNASPGSSAFALFGDTPFFLDVFPPQLQGDKFAVGATLAKGGDPLPGAEIRLEPIAGILPEPIRLYDDGRHGDGRAGDGVYGNVVDFDDPDVDRFDVVVRAAGTAWDAGRFVRQTTGLTVRTPEDIEPPPPGPTLAGDLDFGVLFPGETGKARIVTEFDAPAPGDFLLELTWPDRRLDLDPQSAVVTINPGRREFELEITIPESAPVGSYRGVLGVMRGDVPVDEKEARVRVGTVIFGRVGEVDLGVIPPGTANFVRLSVPYRADKAAPLSASVRGDLGLDAKLQQEFIDGEGQATVEITASSPMNSPNRDMTGVVTLMAGPGYVDIPVRWTVRAYETGALPEAEGPEGLPSAPTLPTVTRPLELSPLDTKSSELPPLDDAGGGIGTAADSPWERVAKTVERSVGDRDGAVDISLPASMPEFGSGIDGPDRYEDYLKEKEQSFWNAWWLYILAALLLLLLLLLLLCYILYRLGKSAMARFLLASVIANLVMIAVFIWLLSTTDQVEFPERELIEVTLSEDDGADRVSISSGEAGLLQQAGAQSGEAGQTGSDEAAQSMAPSGGSVLPAERRAEAASSGELASAVDAARAPSIVSIDAAENDAMRRRGRQPDRGRRDTPMPELPEAADPFGGEATAQNDETGFEGNRDDALEPIDITIETERDQQARSGEERRRESAVVGETVRLADSAQVEVVELEPAPVLTESRGRRRRSERSPAVTPEPRVQIDDPLREETTATVAEVSEASDESSGIIESALPRSGGAPAVDARPGTAAGGVEHSDLADGGSAGPVGFEAGRAADAPAGRRDRRQGRRAGDGSDDAPGSLRLAMLESGDSGGGEGRATAPGGGAPNREAGGEARYDGASRDRDKGSSGLLKALERERADGGGDGQGSGPVGAVALDGPGSSSSRQTSDFAQSGNGGQSPSRNDQAGRNGKRSGLQAANEPGSRGLPGGSPDKSGNGDKADGGGGGEQYDDDGWGGLGDRLAAINHEARMNGVSTGDGEGSDRPDAGQGSGVPAGRLGDSGSRIDVAGRAPSSDGGWSRNVRKTPRRGVIEASSSLDADSLLVVVGDFSRLPDPASENLFAILTSRRMPGVTIEERSLNPDDPTLGDCLLALADSEEVAAWSDESLASIRAYLSGGGHIWIDGRNRDSVDDAMMKLAGATGGEYERLSDSHQLAESGDVAGLFVGDSLAVVATDWGWRGDWRYGDAQNGRTLRFLARSLNYFLSGNADQGIEIDNIERRGGLLVEAADTDMPEYVSANGGKARGKVWERFGAASPTVWKSAPWGDAVRLSSAPDGRGGQTLKMDFDASKKGRMALYRMLSPTEDFSRTDELALDVYYSGDGEAALSLILTAPAESTWVDYETPAATLAQGWNKIAFPVANGQFRPLAGGGGFARSLPGADKLGRLGFIVARQGRTPGVILFGDINLNDQ